MNEPIFIGLSGNLILNWGKLCSGGKTWKHLHECYHQQYHNIMRKDSGLELGPRLALVFIEHVAIGTSLFFA